MSEDIHYEIQFYEKLIEKKPDFFEALSALGDLYTRQGLYDKGLEIDRKLFKLKPDDPIVLYNLACSYSLLNDIEKSLFFIKESVKYGYDDFKHMEKDSDLSNLRSDSRFRNYYSSVKEKKVG